MNVVNDMNEKDWNVTDGLQPNQRLYVKQAPSRVRVLINNSMVHLPAEWLEDAYVLDDGGDIAEGYSLIRIPRYDNARGKVKNSDIVFYTQQNPELIYKNRLEIGEKQATPRLQALDDVFHRYDAFDWSFRYKDTSSTSTSQDEEVEDEEIVPEAPEWLNNICNRIDALEAQVEMLEPENFRNLVMSLIESPAFAHMVFNTVRQQSIRYQNSQKTIKELWDSNTPLYYRDKGWR